MTISKQAAGPVLDAMRKNIRVASSMLNKVTAMFRLKKKSRNGKRNLSDADNETHQLLVKRIMQMEQDLTHQEMASMSTGASKTNTGDGHSEIL